MRVIAVVLFALIFVGLIIAISFSGNITRRGERIFVAGLILTVASLGAFLTSALVIGLWMGL